MPPGTDGPTLNRGLLTPICPASLIEALINSLPLGFICP